MQWNLVDNVWKSGENTMNSFRSNSFKTDFPILYFTSWDKSCSCTEFFNYSFYSFFLLRTPLNLAEFLRPVCSVIISMTHYVLKWVGFYIGPSYIFVGAKAHAGDLVLYSCRPLSLMDGPRYLLAAILRMNFACYLTLVNPNVWPLFRGIAQLMLAWQSPWFMHGSSDWISVTCPGVISLTTHISPDAGVWLFNARVNNPIIHFSAPDSVTRNRLFVAYRCSHYGCEIWDLGLQCSAMND